MLQSTASIYLYTDREILAIGLGRSILAGNRVEVLGLDPLVAPPAREDGTPPAGAIVLDAPAEESRLISRLRFLCPDVPLIVWERATGTEPALKALGWGIQGILLDKSPARDILACLDTVVNGGVWIPQSITEAVVSCRRCRVTRREGQLIKLVSQGLCNKEIAYALGISVGTVKVYLSRLFDKLEVSDRYELALLALRQGGSGKSGPDPAGPERAMAPTMEECPEAIFVPRRSQRRDVWAGPGVSREATLFPGRSAGSYF